jgi:hypothetical protein
MSGLLRTVPARCSAQNLTPRRRSQKVKSLRSLHVTKAEFQQSTGCRLCPHTRCRSDGSKLPARCWGPARQRPEPTREAEQLFGYDRDRHERPGQVRYASRQRARIQAARRGAAIRAILNRKWNASGPQWPSINSRSVRGYILTRGRGEKCRRAHARSSSAYRRRTVNFSISSGANIKIISTSRRKAS